jgi:hypothetical protein
MVISIYCVAIVAPYSWQLKSNTAVVIIFQLHTVRPQCGAANEAARDVSE